MEPIVSPWFIYFLGIADGVSEGLHILAFISGFGFVVAMIARAIGSSDEDAKRFAKSLTPWVTLVFIILSICAMLMPSSKTLIGMYAAGQITPDTIKHAIATGRDFKDEIKGDIIEIIRSANEKEEKK